MNQQTLATWFSSRDVEHYTPREILDAAVLVLGSIDLDPAAEPVEPGQPHNVPATTHFTRAEDGLSRPWHGRVFLNPPYCKPESACKRKCKKKICEERGFHMNAPTPGTDDWICYALGEHQAGRMTEAILLLPARTDTEWYGRLRDFPRCHVTGRIRYVGNEAGAPFPSAVFYLGPKVRLFCDVFSRFGDVFTRLDAPVLRVACAAKALEQAREGIRQHLKTSDAVVPALALDAVEVADIELRAALAWWGLSEARTPAEVRP